MEERRKDHSSQIMEAIGSLKEDFGNHRLQAEARHTEISTKLKAIIGNGQPGILQNMQSQIDNHETHIQRQKGAQEIKKSSTSDGFSRWAIIVAVLAILADVGMHFAK